MRTRGKESSSAVGRVTPCAPAFDRPRNGAHGATRPTPKLWLIALVLLSTLNLQLSTARAQTYSIDWSTIDGGGGTSTGGVYSVSGTIGQPDGGTMSSGNYSLAGGFWSLLSVVQTPGAPLLSITLTATNTAMVSWPSPSTGFQLQQNTNLNTTNWIAPAQTVTNNGTINFIIVNPPTGNRFYRLVH